VIELSLAVGTLTPFYTTFNFFFLHRRFYENSFGSFPKKSKNFISKIQEEKSSLDVSMNREKFLSV
jgi:hypothetical protein